MSNTYFVTQEFDCLNLCYKIRQRDQDENGHAIYIWLYGPTGSGKSALVKQFAKANNKDLLSLSLNSSTSIEELLGYCQAVNGSTSFKDGVLTEAVRLGKWLLLEEFDTADPSLMTSLHQLADSDGGIRTLGNEWIPRHKDFALFVTANSAGTGDESGTYTGVATQNHAFLNRFDKIYVPYLSIKQECELIKGYGICTEDTSLRTARFLSAIRASHNSGNLKSVISLRQVRRFLDYFNFVMEKKIASCKVKFNNTDEKNQWLKETKVSSLFAALTYFFEVTSQDYLNACELAHKIYGLDDDAVNKAIKMHNERQLGNDEDEEE